MQVIFFSIYTTLIPRPIFDQTRSRLVNASKRVDREKRLEQGRVVHVTVDCYSCPWIERRWDWIIPLPTRKQASTLGWIERDARIWLRITGLDSFTLLFRFLAHSRLWTIKLLFTRRLNSPPSRVIIKRCFYLSVKRVYSDNLNLFLNEWVI